MDEDWAGATGMTVPFCSVIAALPALAQLVQKLWISVGLVELPFRVLEGAELVILMIGVNKSILENVNNPQGVQAFGGLIYEVIFYVAFVGH